MKRPAVDMRDETYGTMTYEDTASISEIYYPKCLLLFPSSVWLCLKVLGIEEGE